MFHGHHIISYEIILWVWKGYIQSCSMTEDKRNSASVFMYANHLSALSLLSFHVSPNQQQGAVGAASLPRCVWQEQVGMCYWLCFWDWGRLRGDVVGAKLHSQTIFTPVGCLSAWDGRAASLPYPAGSTGPLWTKPAAWRFFCFWFPPGPNWEIWWGDPLAEREREGIRGEAILSWPPEAAFLTLCRIFFFSCQ